MGYDLTAKSGNYYRFNVHYFPKVLRLALAYDWIPMGTVNSTPGWAGEYLTNAKQEVVKQDALNLAEALERALENVTKLPETEELKMPVFIPHVGENREDYYNRVMREMGETGDQSLHIPDKAELSKLLYEFGHKELIDKVRGFIAYCRTGDGFIIQ